MIHFWERQKPGVLKPLPVTVILAILLAVRPVPVWGRLHRAQRAVAVER